MSVFSCKDTVRLLSDNLDSGLSLGQRLVLHVHLWMCNRCRRFRQQLTFLSSAVHSLEDKAANDAAPYQVLAPEARERIKLALGQLDEGRNSYADPEP